jgi:predicted transcriptional regulator with HTH domain
MKTIIKTPRGTFNAIQFNSREEADKNGFSYYFTNDDGRNIYTKYVNEYTCKFAYV